MSASTSTPTPRMRRRTKIVLLVLTVLAVAFTPLAVNGLFAGALANADTSLSSIPAAIVNNDTMTTTTNADGTQTVNFAGRAVVTELTGNDSGFDWNLTNSDDAAAGLANGTYYAVLTIPEDFSATINTLGTTTPEQGLIDIRTDDSHGYLSGIVASTVASAVQAGFGQTVTAQVVNGIYTSFGTVGTSLSDAANGATQLATGADGLATGSSQLADGLNQLGTGAASAASGASQLSDGLGQLSTGAASAASGASELSSGLKTYTDGVTSVSGGLGELATGSTGLGTLSSGISTYTQGVTGTSTQLNALVAQAKADPGAPISSIVDQLTTVSTQLGGIAGQGDKLAAGAAGLPQLESGIAAAASGASQLAAGGPALADGAAQLDSGVGQLASGLAATVPGAQELSSGVGQLASGVQQTVPGAQQLSSGATQLGDGAQTLASGLQSGADQLGANVSSDTSAASDVIAEPVKVDVSTENQVSSIGQVISILMLPTALWIGALALFLWMRPFSRAVLASSATTARLTVRTFLRASGIAAAQVVLLVAFLHLVLGVAWSSFPATLGFSLIVALAFTAFHQLLSTAFGRVGAIVSLVLLALQLASTGGLYPAEILSGPFQAINSVSPLAYAVSGIQAILTGGDASVVLNAALVMGGMLVVSVLLSGVALARRRRPVELGWVVPARRRAAARSPKPLSPKLS